MKENCLSAAPGIMTGNKQLKFFEGTMLALLAILLLSFWMIGCSGGGGGGGDAGSYIAPTSTPSTEPTSDPTDAPTSTPTDTPTSTPTSTPNPTPTSSMSYVIVDTGETKYYDDEGEISSPQEGGAFYGQDANYQGNQPGYVDNGDGTITDLNTGLMWQKDPGDKVTYDEAVAGAGTLELAGYNDWRLPTIKEQYSLILFSGLDPSGLEDDDTSLLVPFIDTDYFGFKYGDPGIGDRIIDSQWVTSTVYVGTTMGGNETVFGVNHADGRIKGYPMANKTFFVLYVRDNTGYGANNFVDNGNGTITDQATGLMWQTDDSEASYNWEEALNYAETLEHAGHTDWQLPNAKELQSIVDYTRSPDTTNSAAIDPIFNSTSITNEAGETDYPFYWTGTTHVGWPDRGDSAVYIAFGRAMGYMFGEWMDVHGAGAQRSDPKSGNPADWPYGHGPQGDAIRIYNYVRCVRGGLSE